MVLIDRDIESGLNFMKPGIGLSSDPIESLWLTTQVTGPHIYAIPVDNESESSANGYGYTVGYPSLPIS